MYACAKAFPPPSLAFSLRLIPPPPSHAAHIDCYVTARSMHRKEISVSWWKPHGGAYVNSLKELNYAPNEYIFTATMAHVRPYIFIYIEMHLCTMFSCTFHWRSTILHSQGFNGSLIVRFASVVIRSPRLPLSFCFNMLGSTYSLQW